MPSECLTVDLLAFLKASDDTKEGDEGEEAMSKWDRAMQRVDEESLNAAKSAILTSINGTPGKDLSEKIFNLFKDLDSDKSGDIDRDELGEGLRSVGIRLNFRQLISLMNMMDTDGSGTVNLHEFLVLISATMAEKAQQEVSDDPEQLQIHKKSSASVFGEQIPDRSRRLSHSPIPLNRPSNSRSCSRSPSRPSSRPSSRSGPTHKSLSDKRDEALRRASSTKPDEPIVTEDPIEEEEEEAVSGVEPSSPSVQSTSASGFFGDTAESTMTQFLEVATHSGPEEPSVTPPRKVGTVFPTKSSSKLKAKSSEESQRNLELLAKVKKLEHENKLLKEQVDQYKADEVLAKLPNMSSNPPKSITEYEQALLRKNLSVGPDGKRPLGSSL